MKKNSGRPRVGTEKIYIKLTDEQHQFFEKNGYDGDFVRYVLDKYLGICRHDFYESHEEGYICLSCQKILPKHPSKKWDLLEALRKQKEAEEKHVENFHELRAKIEDDEKNNTHIFL